MVMKLVSRPKYQIERAGFENVRFTESSKNYMIWPRAVLFADERGAILQSARDGLALRIEADGQDGANKYQATRTGVAYVKVNGKWHAAFDDIADKEQNIVLAKPKNNAWIDLPILCLICP